MLKRILELITAFAMMKQILALLTALTLLLGCAGALAEAVPADDEEK